MRRKAAKKREIKPDYKYQDKDVARLINYIMKGGKADTARKIVYQGFDIIEDKLKKNPLEVFKEALDNVRPLMQVRSRRVGGATYAVPMEVSIDKSQSIALRWMVDAIRQRALKSAQKDLAQVLMDSSNKTGYAFSKRTEMHKQADANKAFAHFRW